MSSTQLPKTIMKLKTWNMFTYNKKYKIKSTLNTIRKMCMYNIKKEGRVKTAHIRILFKLVSII